jgi:hypothetical protein
MLNPLSIALAWSADLTNLNLRGSDLIRATGEILCPDSASRTWSLRDFFSPPFAGAAAM